MSDQPTDTFGFRLRAAMRRAGVRNQELADALGIYVKTVSKWLSDKHVPDEATVAAIAGKLGVTAAWLRYGRESGPGATLPLTLPGTGTVRDGPSIPEAYPQQVRARIRQFEAEATTEGASEFEIDFIHRTLTSPEATVMYQGGHPRDLTGEEWLQQVEALIVGLRAWLKERHRRARAGGHT